MMAISIEQKIIYICNNKKEKKTVRRKQSEKKTEY